MKSSSSLNLATMSSSNLTINLCERRGREGGRREKRIEEGRERKRERERERASE